MFGIGPAGTGKTYLAMAQAVSFLLAKRVSRIILARPAVEAGEKLGFLPGDLQEKVNPYLRPLYDALYDMIEIERAERLLERGTIEVAPIAFMRGRTLNDAFVILDEAQNTTSEQMKMFLTRLGFGSKAVITGDITQIDLPIGPHLGPGRGDEGRRQHRGHRVRPLRRQGRRAPQLVQQIVKAYEVVRWIPTVDACVVTVTDGRGRAVARWRLARWLAARRPGARCAAKWPSRWSPIARIRALNRQYRRQGLRRPTCCRFPVRRLRLARQAARGQRARDPAASLGDIVIATGVARRQAREAGHSYRPSCASSPFMGCFTCWATTTTTRTTTAGWPGSRRGCAAGRPARRADRASVRAATGSAAER